ncbi:MAG: endonuclease V [Candidatus Bathyarchaeia archaeon]
MLKSRFHNINLSKFENVQRVIASKIILSDMFHKPLRRVAGVDVSFKNNFGCAASVILDIQDMSIVDVSYASGKVSVPYYPGFLGFREIQLSMKSIKKLNEWFDILLCNGHGIAHPRSCGLASHIGVVLNSPTIGVALNPLKGFEYEEPSKDGESKPIFYSGRHVGYILRHHARYIFISPGNMVSLDSCLEIVRSCMDAHILPEPLYLAHALSKKYMNSLYPGLT